MTPRKLIAACRQGLDAIERAEEHLRALAELARPLYERTPHRTLPEPPEAQAAAPPPAILLITDDSGRVVGHLDTTPRPPRPPRKRSPKL